MKPSTSKKKPRFGCWLRVLGVTTLAVIVILGGAYFWLNEPRPSGTPGPEADALARRMMAAVNIDAWERTGAVRWTFRGAHDHLWDRDRHWARVAWDDWTVWLDLHTRRGVVHRRGIRVSPEEAKPQLEKAWKYWVNDSFWLNPVAKLYDEGVRREWVPLENGERGLLVTYQQGGVTPGDAYLWVLGADDLPRAWKMWVSILPVGGVETSWEQWQLLATGAKVATLHRTAVGDLKLSAIEGASSLAELTPGADPFQPLSEGE